MSNDNWMPKSETHDKYCDWLIANKYDPCCKEEDDECYQAYLAEQNQRREANENREDIKDDYAETVRHEYERIVYDGLRHD